MPWFEAFIHGRNFIINTGDKYQRHGFYTSRVVEAKDIDSAKAAALKSIKNDRKLSENVLNIDSTVDPPQIVIEEVKLCTRFKETSTELVFFLDEK